MMLTYLVFPPLSSPSVLLPFPSIISHTCFFYATIFVRDFARAKACVSDSVTKSCAIGKFMIKDSYSIFCSSKRDPLVIPPKGQ